jgi:DNA-binding CsgD family transcriptional regulator
MELLERESQLAALNNALAQANSGSGRIVLVSGEAGIGKTSLIQSFADAHRSRVRVLWGACDLLFTPRPLGPLHDMAIQMDGEINDLLHTDANRGRLFTTILVEFKRRPCLAVFEDVHWADEATLDLLRYLGRRITQTFTLLVLTYRDDELGTRHPLLGLLGDLANSSATQRIPLSPLSEMAVNRLVRDHRVNGAALHRQTGGNPFYVTEVLASQDGGIPASIRDAVLARTARLSLSARAVLETAAVIGMRIEPWLLDLATGSEASAAEESIEAGILLPQGDTLAFRHDLTRQTVLASISPARKPVLHRLVLDALKSSPLTRNDLSRLAYHAEACGDHLAVLENAPGAANDAASAGAHREAASLFGLALRYADELQPVEHALLLQDYARECNVTERQSEAIEAQIKAAQIWEQLENPTKQAETLAVLAIMLRNHGENSSAERVNRTAVEMLEALSPGPELALAYRVQATLSLSRRDYAEAIRWGERAIEISKVFSDENNLAMAHVAVGTATLFLDYEGGCDYLDKRIAIAQSSGEDRHIANLYAYAGSCSVELFQFIRAERYLTEGIAYTAERGLDIFNRYLLAWQALALIHRGRWEEASQTCSYLLHNPTYPVITRITALVAVGRLRGRRGDPGVQTALNEALELATQTGSLQYLGLVSAARAEAAILAGDPEGALTATQVAFDLAVSKRHAWYTGELAFWRWKAGGQPVVYDWMAKPFAAQLAGDWRQAAAIWEQMGCPYEQARALADGDGKAQIMALNLYERLGARPAAEHTRQQLRAAGVSKLPRLPRRATLDNPFGLTKRQVDILGLLIDGLSNAQIASRLHISPKTVDHHVSAILARLDVHSRESAADLARGHPYFASR